jgi:hypothetical protein
MADFKQMINEEVANGHPMAIALYLNGPGTVPAQLEFRGQCHTEQLEGYSALHGHFAEDGISYLEGETQIAAPVPKDACPHPGQNLRMEIVGHAIDMRISNLSSVGLVTIKSTSPPLILADSPSTEMVRESYQRIRREAEAASKPETYMDRPPLL